MLRLILGAAVLLASHAFAAAAPRSPIPADPQIRGILSERIDDQKQSVGIVVGVLEARSRRIVAHGHFARGDPRLVDGDTVFEIGSVTKVFTALLLADMVRRGEVRLRDPVASSLPEGVTLPRRGGTAITLEDLATHRSGLPRLPGNLAPSDHDNPYADYRVEQLYEFLSRYRLTRDIGSAYEYSNLGYGLLGHALALHSGSDYETLVRGSISAPLAMRSTAVTLTPDLMGRLATGHNHLLQAVPNWDLPSLSGAGALRSTANDLLNLLEMALGEREGPLGHALAAMLAVRWPTGAPGIDTALGWIVEQSGDDEMVWHNGGTGGYRSFVGFLPRAKTGVVVLSNTFTSIGVDDIGRHLLDPELALAPPPKERTAVRIAPDLFDGYVGRYRLGGNFILTVTREGDRLFAQATAQQKAEIFPEGVRHFFYRLVDAQVTFETDHKGRATRMILHQGGQDIPGLRIDD